MQNFIVALWFMLYKVYTQSHVADM